MTSTLESAVESKDGITTKLLVKLQVSSLYARLSLSYNRLLCSLPNAILMFDAPLKKKNSTMELGFYLTSVTFHFYDQNGSFVEAVIMKYDPSLGTYDGKPRTGSQRSTLCISSQVFSSQMLLIIICRIWLCLWIWSCALFHMLSVPTFFFFLMFQVGCKMGCKFCATGSMGFKSNLSSGEIVEQLVHALSFSRIRNVVFMVYTSVSSSYSTCFGWISFSNAILF